MQHWRSIDDAAGECFDKASANLWARSTLPGLVIDRPLSSVKPKSLRLSLTVAKRPQRRFQLQRFENFHPVFLRDHPALLETNNRWGLVRQRAGGTVEPPSRKLIRAAKRLGVKCVTASGGVSCNRNLRTELAHACKRHQFTPGSRRNPLHRQRRHDRHFAERKLQHGCAITSCDDEIAPGLQLA